MNKIMSMEERYLNDSIFHNFVDTVRAYLEQGNFTPTEAREAVHLACLHFEQLNIRTHFKIDRKLF